MMVEKDDEGVAIVIQFGKHKREYCLHNSLVIDEDLEIVTCTKCNHTISAFAAIRVMMRLSGKWKRQKAAADLAREEASKKTRTKCQHCERMTEIKTNVTDMRIVRRVEEEEAHERKQPGPV